MKYLSTREIATKWGVSLRAVQSFCSTGRIPGAKSLGKQWMIPADAVRPADTRFKESRSGAMVYKFPLFVYSPAYAYSDSLNPHEYDLFIAQMKMLEGDYLESISLCRNLLTTVIPAHLMMGAYYTIAHCSMNLGNYYEYNKSLTAMDALISADDSYPEDYKLLIDSIKRYVGWNHRIFDNIDAARLSSDARYFYQYECLLSVSIDDKIVSKDTLNIYDVLALQVSSDGIAPLASNIRFPLASLHIAVSDSGAEDHIETGCKIALSGNWIHILAKNFSFAKTMIKESLDRNAPGYYKSVAELADRDFNNWRIINKQASGICPFETFDPRDISVLFMISQGLSNRSICTVMNLSSMELQNILREFYKTANVKNKNELTKYATSQLTTWFKL